MYDPRYFRRLIDEFNDIDENINKLESFLCGNAIEDLTDWKSSFKNTAKCPVDDLRNQLYYMNGYRRCVRNRIVAYIDRVR